MSEEVFVAKKTFKDMHFSLYPVIKVCIFGSAKMSVFNFHYVDCLIYWLLDCLIDWFIYWLIYWLILLILLILLIWLINWLLWLIDCLINWLLDWLIDWLIDRFIDRYLFRDNTNSKDMEKAESKVKKAQEDYRNLVDKYSSVLQEFDKKMGTSCKHFQQEQNNYLYLLWLPVSRGEGGQPQQFVVRATFFSFSRPSHLEILVLRLICVWKSPIL